MNEKLIEAANALLAAFRAASPSSRGDDIQSAEMHSGRWASAGIRYFGKWEMPEGEEDDGDYDWEIPTAPTMDRANAILAKVAAQYPDLNLFISVSEKNWLDLQASERRAA